MLILQSWDTSTGDSSKLLEGDEAWDPQSFTFSKPFRRLGGWESRAQLETVVCPPLNKREYMARFLILFLKEKM